MNKRQIEKFRKMLRQIQRDLMELFRNDAQCCGISMAQCHAMIELGITGKTYERSKLVFEAPILLVLPVRRFAQ